MTGSELNWLDHLGRLLGSDPCVLVTLLIKKGSAPRESGARMVVSKGCIAGSIGGGNLEYQVTAHAQEMLENTDSSQQQLRNYGLGPALNQCCVGAVDVLFERYRKGGPPWLNDVLHALIRRQPFCLASRIDVETPVKIVVPMGVDSVPGSEPFVMAACRRLFCVDPTAPQLQASAPAPIGAARAATRAAHATQNGALWWVERLEQSNRKLLLFGAGHVGQAVARVLAPLPFDIHWIDSRPDIFPLDLAGNLITDTCADPVSRVAEADPGCLFVVMTHSHELDENICHAVLERNDFEWLGLIGSTTKRARFMHRLGQRGIEEARLGRLICPIGLSGILGKQPATIALSLAAQLMLEEARPDAENSRNSVSSQR